MLPLLLAISSSSAIALLFKVSEGGRFNRYRVTCANYFAAFSICLLTFLSSKSSFTLNHFAETDWLFMLLLGIPAGLCFFLSFIFYQKSVKENGASLSAMTGKLGILLPMIASIYFWREFPSAKQFVGILLALFAMILITRPETTSSSTPKKFHISLIGLFLMGGFAEFSNKLFQKLGQASDKHVFLFVVFFVAFLLSLFMAVRTKPLAGSHLIADLAMGFSVGIPNLFSSVFLISALSHLPAAVVFPAYSTGSILFVTLVSCLFFKERLSKRAAFGLCLTLFALVLLV